MEGLRGSAMLFALQGAFRRGRAADRGGGELVPLADADIRATGHRVAFWQNWLGKAIGNESFWEPLDHRHRLGPRTAPNLFVSGWYDFMLDPMLRDYAALVDAGHRPYLTIGPWMHTDLAMLSHGVDETLRWFETHLLGKTGVLREKPVRVEIIGRRGTSSTSGRRAMSTTRSGTSTPARRSRRAPPDRGDPDRYRYDPADPTPNVGGAHLRLLRRRRAGPGGARGAAGRADLHLGAAVHRPDGHRATAASRCSPARACPTPTSS